jgi:predicted HTH transcriptional regulator
MTRDEILARLNDKEDNFVERKSEGVSPRDIRQTASAFANTVDARDAVLFIGVHDRTGEVVGVGNAEAVQKRVSEACDDCYPAITYTSEVLQVEGLTVVAVVFPPSDHKPHFTGAAFVRPRLPES